MGPPTRGGPAAAVPVADAPAAPSARPSVLFLTYTGLLEPLGRSQVLPYVRGLARRGHPMVIVSFEKAEARPGEREEAAALLRREGIAWHGLRYHKRPPLLSTLFDVVAGLVRVLRAAGKPVGLIHARSHVPALIADLAGMITGVPFLFDHRGLMAEEYADAGIWPRPGWAYRATEACERRFLRRARHVVVLTDRLREDLAAIGDRVSVIPCAVDLATFRPPEPGRPRPFDLVYAGSWSGLYLGRETLAFFEAYRRKRPQARLLILLREGREIREAPAGVVVRQAAPEEIPDLLRTARAGISFRGTGRAQAAASPVKVSEYLACGLPVLSSAGVGDLDRLLPGTRTGLIVPSFSPAELERTASALIGLLEEEVAVSARCRRLAEERYGLEAAVAAYDRVYRSMLGGAATA